MLILNRSFCRVGIAHIKQMDTGQGFIGVIIQREQIPFLPVLKCPQYILFRVIELVRNIRHTGGHAGAQHTKKIEIYLQLCIVGIFHISINKAIGNSSAVGIYIVINCNSPHFNLPSLSFIRDYSMGIPKWESAF